MISWIKNLFTIEINTNRIYGLDILRAWAILFVMISHSNFLLKYFIPEHLLNLFVFEGVSIFFVLSGFLIGGILIKVFEKEGISSRVLINFWIRRWFRTLPNYFLILIILIVLRNVLFDLKLIEVKSYFIFFQNFNWVHPHFFQEAWSLSIEEWFYLIVPICAVFLARILNLNTRSSILIISFIILLTITFIRVYKYNSIDDCNLLYWDKTFRKQVLTRLDSLMFGVIGAVISHYFPKLWAYRIKTLFIIGIVIILVHKITWVYAPESLHTPYYTVFTFSLFSFGTLLLLPFLNTIRSGSGIVYKAFTIISLISYSLYLVNFSLVQHILIPGFSKIIGTTGSVDMIIRILLFWLVSFAISILLYKYFELPTMNLRDKIKIRNAIKK